jgi:hypothetical protein
VYGDAVQRYRVLAKTSIFHTHRVVVADAKGNIELDDLPAKFPLGTGICLQAGAAQASMREVLLSSASGCPSPRGGLGAAASCHNHSPSRSATGFG